jgi:hypothetical protein
MAENRQQLKMATTLNEGIVRYVRVYAENGEKRLKTVSELA